MSRAASVACGSAGFVGLPRVSRFEFPAALRSSFPLPLESHFIAPRIRPEKSCLNKSVIITELPACRL